MTRADYTGRRFGRLVVTSMVSQSGGKAQAYCRCDCGNTTIVYATALQSGATKSCGCLRTEVSRKRMQERATAIKRAKRRANIAMALFIGTFVVALVLAYALQEFAR